MEEYMKFDVIISRCPELNACLGATYVSSGCT